MFDIKSLNLTVEIKNLENKFKFQFINTWKIRNNKDILFKKLFKKNNEL